MMNQQRQAAGEIRYDLRASLPRFTKWIAWILVATQVLLVAQYAVQGASPVHYVIPVFVIAMLCVGSTRNLNTIVINTQGIRPPTRRFIPWSEVEAVHQSKDSSGVSLQLVGGRDRSTGLPAEYAQQVAAIGNVPLT